MTTLLWHDYETFGLDPAVDRPVQFAAIRTDLEFNVLEEEIMLYARPSADYLPSPIACSITGITPQQAFEEGVSEAEFIAQINQHMSVPNTCSLGYNTLRFDDEVTRHTLYRNFHDPYEREWKNGNSRWDLLDIVRLTRALRPEGINWPVNEDGQPSNKLEHLTAANHIDHGHAHDALADVRATIAIAKLIKEQQPRLFDYMFTLRQKQKVADILNVREQAPVVHVSGMISGAYQHTAVVIPLASHPYNRNGIIVYDLRYDPTPLLTLDADTLKERLFTPREKLPEGVERLPLKTIHINRCPVVAPLKTLDAASQQRLNIDLPQSLKHAEALRANSDITAKIESIFARPTNTPVTNPDKMLYSGGFFSPEDKLRINTIRQSSPEALQDFHAPFEDARLPEMLFRYRGRNFPHTLSGDELERWKEFCIEQLTLGDGTTFAKFTQELDAIRTPENAELCQQLADYAELLRSELALDY